MIDPQYYSERKNEYLINNKQETGGKGNLLPPEIQQWEETTGK